MSGTILDNDVLLKAAPWSMAGDVAKALDHRGGACVLGVTALVVAKQLSKSRRVTNTATAASSLDELLKLAAKLEPTPEETEMAADLEGYAQTQGLALDSGESLIAAVAATRAGASMLTGDKRAIAALETITAALNRTESLAGKIACLEQLISAIGNLRAPTELRAMICAEAAMDSAMGIVFRCHSSAALDAAEMQEGLRSYVESVRARAPTLLCAGNTV